MGELAARARLSKQTMTTMVRMLERDGLVRRRQDAQDRRAFRITLTLRARRFRPVVDAVLRELDALVAARIGRHHLRRLEAGLKGVMEL